MNSSTRRNIFISTEIDINIRVDTDILIKFNEIHKGIRLCAEIDLSMNEFVSFAETD